MSGEQTPEQRKRRIYDIVVDEGGPVRKEEQDPLEQVIEEGDRRLAQDIRRARAEAILADEQRKKHQAQRGVQVDDGTGTVELTGPVRQQQPVSAAGSIITGLIQGGMSPEKAKEYIASLAPEDIAKLNMFASGPRSGGMDPMMAMMLLGKFGSQPEVKVSDLLAIGPKFVESAKSMAEMNRPSGPNEYVGLLTKMIEEAGKDRKDAIDTKLELLRQQMQGSDPIKTTAEAIKSLKDLGMIPERGGENKPEIDLKIEEMRTERELEMAKMRIDMNKWMTEKSAETERWNSIMTSAPAALAMFSKPLEEAVRGAARKTSQPQQVVIQQPVPAGQPALADQAVRVECQQCHSLLEVKPPFPETLACPSCGHTGKFPTV